MSFSTPILFLVFNRPDTTSRVFEEIRKLKPLRLYIAADGPRNHVSTDEKNCLEVKQVVANIDWPCELQTLYRSQNLGCKVAVSNAITWFFDQVEEGIILEDDILPDQSFFHFCAAMLERYRFDKNVMHVSGFNILGTWKENEQSHHFSYFGTIWGWATWRLSWKLYDVAIRRWNEIETKDYILTTYFPPAYRESRKILYDKLYKGEIDTWDYQWTFCRLLQNGLSVIPSKNLVINIGFDEYATHTQSAPAWAPKTMYSIKPPYSNRELLATDSSYEKKHLETTNEPKKRPVSKFRDFLIKTFKSMIKR